MTAEETIELRRRALDFAVQVQAKFLSLEQTETTVARAEAFAAFLAKPTTTNQQGGEV